MEAVRAAALRVVESGLPRARARVSCMLAGYSFAISVAPAASWARSDGREGAHRVENTGAPTGPSSAPYGGLARAGSSSDPNHGRTGSIIPIHDPVARKFAAGKQSRRHSSDLLRETFLGTH